MKRAICTLTLAAAALVPGCASPPPARTPHGHALERSDHAVLEGFGGAEPQLLGELAPP